MLLAHDPDFAGRLLMGHAQKVLAVESCAAAVRRQRPVQGFKHCGFAAPIRADEAHEFAVVHMKGDVVRRVLVQIGKA